MKKIRFGRIFALFILLCSCTIQAFAAYTTDYPAVSEAYLMINMDSGMIVAEKNAGQRMYPASTTKIMTYIIISEQIADLENTKITVNEKLFEEMKRNGSSMAGLVNGQTLTAKDLLYCLMLPSGNDAAMVLADYITNGDMERFAQMMNEKASSLGCRDTQFVNPHGYHDENHHTTAWDLSLITRYAMQQPFFNEITSSTVHDVPETDALRIRLHNTNLLMEPESNYYYPYCKGIKTGTTTPAGYCFVSYAEKEGVSYLLITLGAPKNVETTHFLDPLHATVDSSKPNGAFTDAAGLYDWAFSQLQQIIAAQADISLTEQRLKRAFFKRKLALYPKADVSAVIPASAATADIEIAYKLPEAVYAPVYPDQVIGKAIFSYQGQLLGESDLIAKEEIKRSFMPLYLSLAFLLVSVSLLGIARKKLKIK